MNTGPFEFIFILILILINGLLAMSEIAVVSARKVRLQQRAEAGDRGAQAALELSNSPGRFLSTVQIGITLVGIFAGAFGGATIAEGLEEVLADVPVVGPYSGAVSVAVVVIMITYLSLVLGELAPKQIALNNAERTAAIVAPGMKTLSRLAGPLVTFLTWSTNLILRLFQLKGDAEPSITEEEVRILISQGAESGVFEPIEQEMVQQVFRMGDRRVISLLTPRHEIDWLDLEDPPEVLREKIMSNLHTHLPVARESLDDLIGFVRINDLMAQCLQGQPLDIQAVLQPAVIVPENLPAFQVLERFKDTRAQIAFVIDEYGGIQGLVTLRDILEAIVGDIPEEEDIADPDVVQREDGTWLLDGMVPVDEFRDLFDLKELPGEEENHFQTLGGFVITQLGRIPIPSEAFEWGKLRFEVMDMDGNRVDKILVTPLGKRDISADETY